MPRKISLTDYPKGIQLEKTRGFTDPDSPFRILEINKRFLNIQETRRMIRP